MNTLPKKDFNEFDPTPDFYNDEQLQLLELPRAVQAAMQRKADVANVAQEQSIDVDELQFASWIVSSRAFRITVFSPEDAQADEASSDGEPGVWVDDKGQVVSKASSKSV